MQNKIKYLLFFIFVISFFYATISLFIIPDMQKKQTIENTISLVNSKVKELKKRYSALQNSFIDLTWYRNYLKNFEGDFSQKDIKPLLEMFGDNIEIKEISKKSGSVKKIQYSVKLDIKSPKDFYSFLNYIDANFIPIKVEYPIIFKKEKSLKLRFAMTLYTL